MGKTLNELAEDLKSYLIEIQSDAHNKGNLRPERYNNLRLLMNISQNPNPHVEIRLGMSAAQYDFRKCEKTEGSLGPDDRYVLRWLGKSTSISALDECWKVIVRNRGRAYEKQTDI